MTATPVRFDHFMSRALYGPDGFYTSGRGSAGRRDGDFITSPEVGPLFGELVARWIEQVWDDSGRPDRLDVIDLGAGPGTLSTALSLASVSCWEATTFHDVDRATAGEVPEDLSQAVVIANELLDNVPFRWVRRQTDAAFEAYVDDGDLLWRPVTDGGVPPFEGEFPWLEQAAALTRSILEAEPLGVLMFDYGTSTTLELAERGGWLRCHRGHQRQHDPLREPGQWDITTDVPLDQLPRPDRHWSQAEFCTDFGIDDLVAEGREYWRAHAALPDLRALRMRSRVNEAAALTDPDGLGGFWAAEWRPSGGISEPPGS